MAKLTVGVLALQGAVREHLKLLALAGAQGLAIKWPDDLPKLDALIIPGGESTTIGKLMVKYGFVDSIKRFHAEGKPIYGTCAGLILLAKTITEGDQPLISLMDIEARRNAFGRQRESFEADMLIEAIGETPFRGVFIRAPWIQKAADSVKVLAKFDNKMVMAQEGNLLVSAFHPELTDDPRIHRYFLDMALASRN